MSLAELWSRSAGRARNAIQTLDEGGARGHSVSRLVELLYPFLVGVRHSALCLISSLFLQAEAYGVGLPSLRLQELGDLVLMGPAQTPVKGITGSLMYGFLTRFTFLISNYSCFLP